MGNLIHKKLSRSIIGAAMEVLNALKPVLDEKLYEPAMAIELRRAGHVVASKNSYPVFYRGEMIGYLIITKLKLALLLNFKNATLSWKRVAWPETAARPPDLYA
ncbi:MAG: GxxExxY protein [Chthoniobacterales bacterium]